MVIKAADLKDHEVTLWDGSRTHLSDWWKDAPLVLVFLRHYG